MSAQPDRTPRHVPGIPDAARLATARSLLFVPGHRPDRFDKAVASGAGLVIVDLEDAVAAEDKDLARDHTAAWLALGNRAVVRINAPGTAWSAADLAMAAGHGCPIMVPKAEDPAVLARLTEATGGRCALIALIETAAGVERALEVCAAPGVVRAAFGNVDLAAQLGVAHDDHTALTCARSKLVLGSAAAGAAPPLDGVTTALGDPAALDADIAHARRLGFTGKLCIHPAQLPAVSKGFAPSESEVAWARAVLAAGARSPRSTDRWSTGPYRNGPAGSSRRLTRRIPASEPRKAPRRRVVLARPRRAAEHPLYALPRRP